MKQPKKEHIIRRLLWEARPIWKWLLLAALLCIGVIVCGVLGPKLLGGLIDRLYAWWDGSDRSDLLAGLLRPMGWLALVYLGYSLFSYVKMQLLNRVVSRYFTCELRIRISDKIRRLPVSYVDQTPVGDILSRMMDDVSTMGNYVHQIIDTLMTGFFMILAIAVMMLLEDWRLAAIVLVLTPASILLSTLLSSRSEKHFYSMFTESGNLNAVTEEAFTNFATTKAYNLEDYTEQRHAELNERRRKAEERARRIEEAKLNKGKKKKTEKKHDEDEDKIPGSVKEHSRVGLRQYARGRAYDPYRYSEEGPTAYPGEAPIFPPRSDSRALKREAHEIEEELREIHTDEAIEDAILEEKALEAPVQEETEVVSAGEESEAPYAEESEAEDDTDKTKE